MMVLRVSKRRNRKMDPMNISRESRVSNRSHNSPDCRGRTVPSAANTARLPRGIFHERFVRTSSHWADSQGPRGWTWPSTRTFTCDKDDGSRGDSTSGLASLTRTKPFLWRPWINRLTPSFDVRHLTRVTRPPVFKRIPTFTGIVEKCLLIVKAIRWIRKNLEPRPL